VDPLTHALASYTLKRAAFPRLPRSATLAMLLAGTLADADLFFSQSGPSAYLAWHRTYLHSLAGALLLSAVVTLLCTQLSRDAFDQRARPLGVLAAAFAAALLHFFLDLGQSLGVEVLWPFTRRRFALDWLPKPDLFIFAALLLALLLPKLASLVTEEIGGRSKRTRGRGAAIFALVLLVVYAGARGVLHGNALAALDARTYYGEPPRRMAAFPESQSPFAWLGVVETERALNEVSVSLAPGAAFDPESARPSYKPEPSAALDAALATMTARRFIASVRFPKASIEKTADGFHIELHAIPYGSVSASSRVMAVIDTDAAGMVLSKSLEWDPRSEQHWWR
jgi:membrane-bound metal-dependent hydrolase YbcI (DUF457 family)